VNRYVDIDDEAVLAEFADPTRTKAVREAAFGEIVHRYERRVFAVCFRQLGSRDDAEDATQQTFINLARRADQFRGDSKLSTFVYRVAVNACRDLARKQARRPSTPVEDIEQAQRDSGVRMEVVDEFTGRETARLVRDALAQLDELSRTLLILCAVEGMSYPEASEILDLPVGTIKSRVFRARAKLAALLADAEAEPHGDVPPSTTAPPRGRTSAPGAPRGPPG
jgi:RNA polymerase sigma-70 factor (ECF subfamily)